MEKIFIKKMKFNFGKEIKTIREEQGLCIKELAHRANISYATLCAYERGDSHPSLPVAESLLRVLNYELDIHLKE